MIRLQYNQSSERMLCRPPRKIKRYVTEPEQLAHDNRYKYSNLTMQELKLQVGALETLNDINVPPVNINLPQSQKNHNAFMALHPKFHHRRNPLKKLPDLNTQASFNNNGCELPKQPKGGHMFKRSNPLFVVNSLFDILKQDLTSEHVSHEKLKALKSNKASLNNQFTQFDGKSLKVQRGPRLIDSELSRLTQQSKFSRRKIYSEQKSRSKGQDVQLLTFYKPRQREPEDNNQFLS